MDNINGQSFYKHDDVLTIKSLGLLFGEIFNTRKEYFELVKRNRGLINLVQEQRNS